MKKRKPIKRCMKKRFFISILSVLLALALVCAGCTPEQAQTQSPSPAGTESAAVSSVPSPAQESAEAEPLRLEDDFYAYINQDMLEEIHVPEDGVKVGYFSMAQDAVDKQLLADLKRMAEAGKPDEGAEYLSEAVKYFELYTDMESRNAAGAASLRESFAAVDAIESLQDLSENYAEMITKVLIPVSFSVTADVTGAPRNLVYVSNIAPYLPAKSYYQESDEQAQALTAQLEDCLKNLMVMAGEDEAKAAQMVADAIEVDRFFGERLPEANESSAILLNGEMTSLQELSEMCKNLDLAGAVTELFEGAEQVKLTNPQLIKDLDQLVNEENFGKLKNWMKVTAAKNSVDTLSEDFYYALEPFNAMLYGRPAKEGVPAQDELEEKALESVKTYFPQHLSYYYGSTYVDEETIADIQNMTDAMIEEYRARLEENEWMSQTTREKALLKLDTMKATIAYDKNADVSNPVTIASKEEGGTLLKASELLANHVLKKNYESYHEPFEETQRQMMLTANPTYAVNASYVGLMNTITINAAILQAPFYSKDASDSANFGAIGTIIGHELSHAFDQTGSLYDENGQINNWWTDEDRAEFEKRSQKMAELFDGVETQGGTVNGQQTVTENTADAGGLSVALAALKSSGDCDEKEFFEAFGRVWADKMTDEVAVRQLAVDIHAPNKLRVNMQLSNFDAFYETYDISEDDGMYLPAEKRVKIW